MEYSKNLSIQSDNRGVRYDIPGAYGLRLQKDDVINFMRPHTTANKHFLQCT